MGIEVDPCVCGCSDLPQRSEGEPAAAVPEDGGGDRGGCLERQPVLGELGDRPHLLATLNGLLAAVPQVDEVIPGPLTAHAVHEPDEAGEVGCLDEVREGVVGHPATLLRVRHRSSDARLGARPHIDRHRPDADGCKGNRGVR